MLGLNNVQIIGNLGAAREMKYVNNNDQGRELLCRRERAMEESERRSSGASHVDSNRGLQRPRLCLRGIPETRRSRVRGGPPPNPGIRG
jgi:hypothetical protein